MNIVLVKLGGSTLETEGIVSEVAASVSKLIANGFSPIVVHGGGKDIARALGKMNKKFEFVEGQRVTDKETMDTVQQVLSGDVNKRIVNEFIVEGLTAAGISGVDGSLITAEKLLVNGNDIGFVGTPVHVNSKLIFALLENGIVPVVSPVSRGANGEFFNVNADLAAGKIAEGLKAEHLMFISDVPGVLISGSVKSEIRLSQIDDYIENGEITGGMIPKIKSAENAVKNGIGKVHISEWYGEETLVNELQVKSSKGTVIF